MRHRANWRKRTTVIVNVTLLTAEGEPQRVATALLHLVPAARRFLRTQHVRRRCRRELPQVSWESGAGREGSSRRRPRPQDRPQTQTFVTSRYVMSASFLTSLISTMPNYWHTISTICCVMTSGFYTRLLINLVPCLIKPV